MTKMIPPLPTSAVLMPTPKQKIGFSIESIVGNDTVAASPPQSAVGSSQQLGEQLSATNTANSTSGPGSPPQTPPAMPTNTGITQLPGAPHLTMQLPLPLQLPLTPNALPHHMHAHLPPHLTPAQQHALHQHLLLQHHHQQQQQQQQQQQLSPNSGAPMRQDIQDIIQRLHSSAAAAAVANLNAHSTSPYSPPPTSAQARHNVSPEDAPSAMTQMMNFKRERSPLSAAAEEAQDPAQRQHMNHHHHHQQQQQQQPLPPHTPPKSVSPPSSHPSSPPAILPGSPVAISTPTQQTPPTHPPTPQYPKPSTALGAGPGPMILPGLPHAPGLVRPFPVVGPSGVPPPPPQQGMPDIKALPPYINAPPPELPPQHNPHLIAAAQFQMAAALQGHVLGGGLPPHASPFMAGPGMPRDSYPLYPWLLSRHGRIFPHRFPGNFLLQPFRKPKRIRTAFSPSQLLKLEHAFESNQYVVGAERKALAQSLNLSETQVKVWFQNRRTKHKRMQQEDDKGDGSHSDRSRNPASCDEDDDDELIDMEMDDCPSDDEHELDASH